MLGWQALQSFVQGPPVGVPGGEGVQRKAGGAGGGGLLSQWEKYSDAPQGDVEQGAALPSLDQLGEQAGNVGGAAAAAAGGLFQMVSQQASGLGQSANRAMADSVGFSLPSQQQLSLMLGLLALGAFFISFSIFVALPMVVLAPGKFATSFTLGQVCFMGAFAALRGWRQQLDHMVSADRLPFTSVYVGSMLLTLYSAVVMKSYLLSILSAGAQVVALLYYVMSYFPGGEAGVKAVLSMASSGAMGCARMVTAMFR